jgi:ribonuclease G
MKSIIVSIDPEETRMAIIEDEELLEMEVERPESLHLVGNIYKGQVQNVLPGMQAAFVDIGYEKNAFLYIGDGLPQEALQSVPKQAKIHIGQKLPIQIVKDAVSTKGPRATMHLTLPGRNVVLMPLADYIGISRRIESEAERLRLKDIAEKLCPKGMGLIVRTVAAGQSEKALQQDVEYLVKLWQSLMARYQLSASPTLLYRDADLLIRLVRDYFSEDIDLLVIDDKAAYQRICDLVEYISPSMLNRVKLYRGSRPIFEEYHIEQEIENVGKREVELKSGGFIVIDKAEALTVIDVNTGKFVGQTDLADTVFQVNLEAAAEIARQIRLRDIGGIIIVDFIDMETQAQKQTLLHFLEEKTRADKTKTNVVDITSLGLVEITRKKSRQNLESMVYTQCPCCGGRGSVESPETITIKISRALRRLEKNRHESSGYTIQVHVEVAEELKKSKLLEKLTREFGCKIQLEAKQGLHPEVYSILHNGNE